MNAEADGGSRPGSGDVGIGMRLLKFANVLSTLMTREIHARFASDPLGYAWAFLTPLAWIGGIYAFFMLTARYTPIYTDAISFIMSGMLPYMVFRSTITSVMRAGSANRYMLHFRTVSEHDVFLSAAALELFNGLVVYVGVFSLNYLVFAKAEMHDPLTALLGYLIAWGLGASLGHLGAVLAQSYESVSRILPIALRPMFLLSGIFYTANELPDAIAAVLQFNPLLHAIEIVRTGAFMSYETRLGNVYFPVLAALALYALALALTGSLAARRVEE